MAGELGSVSVRLGGEGAAVSTVNERLAGVRSVFWAESVARTSKRWAPSESCVDGV